jgi:hypothetical protein
MTTTNPDPMTAPPRVLVDALRRGAEGADMRAAVEVLVGYNDGDLLGYAAVRERIGVWDKTTGTMRISWPDLYGALEHREGDLVGLSETGEGALRLACALRHNVPMGNLSTLLGRLDRDNSLVAARAFSIALGVRSTDVAAIVRQNERYRDAVQALRAALSTDDNNGGMAAEVRLADGEPVDAEGEPIPPMRAIAVADVARILDEHLGPAATLYDVDRPAPAGWDKIEAGAERLTATDDPADLRDPIRAELSAAAGISQGVTVGALVELLRTRWDIDASQAAVIVTLARIAAESGNVTQPDPHGPYYWRETS